MTEIYTKSEFTAYQLLSRFYNLTEITDMHEAGNRIIILAEKIKAERAVLAINKG